MADANATLAVIVRGWQAHQAWLCAALAPLTAKQLALRLAPHLRSVEEAAPHHQRACGLVPQYSGGGRRGLPRVT